MKLKDYILQWNNNYQAIFQKSRLLSQIPIFTIAVIGFYQVGEAFYAISRTENPSSELDLYWIFRLLVFPSLFFARFILLFSKSKILFWLSQVVWLIYFVLFWNRFGSYSAGCPKTFETFVFLYMLCSFVRQNVSLFMSFFFHKLSIGQR